MRLLSIILLFAALAPSRGVGSRIKDLVMVAGARDNQISGFGLVVGLAGDGDKNASTTIQAIANALQRYGVNLPAATISSKNIAAVFVTAARSLRVSSRPSVAS